MKAEEKIAKAFLELYEEKPFFKISVKEVCEKAMVARATFYVYYESVEHLLTELEDGIIADISDILDDWKDVSFLRFDYRSKPFRAILKCNQYVAEHYAFYRALWGPSGSMAFIEKYNQMVEQSFLTKWLDEGFSERAAEIMASASAGAIIHVNGTMICGHFNKASDVSPEEMALISTRMLGAIYEMERECGDS